MAACTECGITIPEGEKLHICVLCESEIFFNDIAQQVETEKTEVETHHADVPATSF